MISGLDVFGQHTEVVCPAAAVYPVILQLLSTLLCYVTKLLVSKTDGLDLVSFHIRITHTHTHIYMLYVALSLTHSFNMSNIILRSP